jgi:predicted nucleotidyltransferase
MDKESALNIAKRYIQYLVDNKYDVVQAILFGSFATGRFNENSDIDIAVVLGKFENRFDTQVKLLMLTTKIDTRIEPHPFEYEDFNNGNPFAYEVMNNGIRIY